MKNEKVSRADFLDLGAALVVARLIRARINSLTRKMSRLDRQSDVFQAVDISQEIEALEKAEKALKEVAIINLNQITENGNENEK